MGFTSDEAKSLLLHFIMKFVMMNMHSFFNFLSFGINCVDIVISRASNYVFIIKPVDGHNRFISMRLIDLFY